MKQLLQNMRDGQAEVVDVPVPTPHAGQALVKVSASLVSAGTERMVVEFAGKSLVGKARSRPDLARQVINKMQREGVAPTLQAAFNRLDQPMALGYSSAGTIVELGPGMDDFKVGQRVACAGGGYAVHAEYNVAPLNLLTPLPDNVDFESAAFTTLGAIALHGLRLAGPQLGENIAVIGLGLLGLLTVQMAAAAGCRVLGIDIDPQRVRLAETFGIQACSRDQAESRSQTLTANRGFDSIIICADTPSNDPVELAGLIARDRAKVVATGAVGLSFPRKVYYEKELSFINSRSYGPGRYDSSYEEDGLDYPLGYIRWTEGRNFEAVVDMLASGRLKVREIITHRFPIEAASEAYQVITGKQQQPFLGVLLTYPEAGDLAASKVINFEVPSSVSQSGVVKLGVLGAGLFANATLLPAVRGNKSIELVGIASAGGLHAQHSGKKFGFRYACSSGQQILDDPAINTVAILTRHHLHADLVTRALGAGKHVFVEKPLALNKEQLEAVARAKQAAPQQQLTVGFNRRFAPLAVTLAHFFCERSEPLYLHYRVNAGYLPLNHWLHDPEQGGGRIIGEGCHFIDFLAFLAGAVPQSVHAAALPDGGKYHGDNLSMTFTFPDGSVGVVDYLANGDRSFPKERVEVFGGGKIAVLDDFRKLELVENGRKHSVKNAQDKGWKAEWAAFAGAVVSGGPPTIPYEQLFGVTRASFAVVESLQCGERIEI
ncbi:MAG: bi-domain-containing oxidoreductase [Anaerolineales bacterium]|nr:bi-domain-containing oxidoreductase [Anaerolineales bacterium]